MTLHRVIVATAVLGCAASESARVRDTAAIALTEDLRIGNADGAGPAAFEQIAALEIDPMGRIWVLDNRTQDIRVFDSTGAYVRTIGRKGAGPGEFRQAVGFAWDPHGRLWVMDQENARYTVLDTSGRVLFTRPRRITGWFSWRWHGGIDTAGYVYEWYRRPGEMSGEVLLRFDSSIAVADTFPMPVYEGETFKYQTRNMSSSASVPFSPFLVWTFDPRGYIWFGITAPYRIYQRSLRGDTIRIFERAYDPLPVTAAERDSAVARLKWFTEQGGKIDPSRIPSEKPAFQRFVVDDQGRMWVVVVTADAKDRSAFDRFTADGRFEGRVLAASSFAPFAPLLVRRSAVYGVMLDADGVPFVVRSRVDR